MVKKQKTPKSGASQQTAVPWKNVAVASQAELVNETTDEGFDMLNEDDDDFMGLQAVEGFEVVYQPDSSGRNKTVRIVKASDPPDQKRKSKKGSNESKSEDLLEEDPSKKLLKNTTKKTSRKLTSSSKKPDHKAEDQRKSSPLEDVSSFKVEDANSSGEDDSVAHQQPSSETDSDQNGVGDDDLNAALHLAHQKGLLIEDDTGDANTIQSSNANLPDWQPFQLAPTIVQALAKLQFTKPTEVQSRTLPLSIGLDGPARDVIGVAETGSGKTLAYGLCILQYIAQNPSKDSDRPLEALILTPTRELALQVTKHLQAVSEAGGNFANIATVCGGMSMQKQQRMLQQHSGAHIVVATPGRLWDLLKQDDGFAQRVRQTRFLVIDEADRMIEMGHFAEMDAILRMIQRSPGPIPANEAMQTLVFSATMAKALQQNLQRKQWRKKKRSAEPSNTLDDLLSRIDFRDSEPAVVELLPERKVASNLLEAKIACINKDKDVYLYYLLLRYPGRTLVFLNSIDGVRRLTPILTALSLDVYPLHGQLQQQQRLRNLDRFRSSSGSTTKVLLATDVAARGIDIQGVDHVVHFQVPRTADAYVHRSGRTARAGQHGISVALVEPNEQRVLNGIWKALKRTDTLATLTIEYTLLDAIRERLRLAKQIDELQHTQNKAKHEDSWIRKMAQEADLNLDSDSEQDNVESQAVAGRKSAKSDAKLASLRAELKALLARPITPRGISQKYLTSTTRPEVMERLLEGNKDVLGIKRSTAHADLSATNKRMKHK
ncbi:RNA helicase [Malassezia psittaci]|uniref:ATP-dependent RNA helicase n=1 Tax=Malassezia psittaci TaxID=1821823 RepID=A0AAF0JDM4_9BASI|nr:RNA helicase [Malassezia psittaci]